MIAKPPLWALAEGVCEPAEIGETFTHYWLRHGFTTRDLVSIFEGLTDRTLCCAHARIGTLLIQSNREAFDTHVSGRLLAAGGRWHEWPWREA